MITLQEFCLYTNTLLQSSAFSDFCVNGLQVEGSKHINRVATGVSASLDTIKAAVECGANALIVHHGLFWNRDSHAITGSKREKLDLLLKNGISLIAYHLPLDAHQELGNNWKAARDMGWYGLEPFCPVNGLPIPIGVKGKVDLMPVQEFQKMLVEYYNHPAYYAFGGKEMIQSVALISGGAHKNITDAISAGVDCYITGSFDEPVWHQSHEEGINFFAMGHSATERVGVQALGQHLQEKFGLEYHFLDIANPF